MFPALVNVTLVVNNKLVEFIIVVTVLVLGVVEMFVLRVVEILEVEDEFVVDVPGVVEMLVLEDEFVLMHSLWY